MATGPGLAMKMTADTVGISRGVTRTEKLLGELSKSTRQATSAMRGLVAIEVGKLLAGGFTSAANAIGGFVSNIRTSVDETAKLAARTGIAVEALQGFQVAAGLSGVQNLEGAVQRLTISIGDAGQGVKSAQDGLSRLGLSFEELSAMAPEDQFRAVSAAISQLPSQAEKAAAAADLFGRTGVELLPLFASNLEEIEARAQRLGIILSGEQTGAIEKMNDALSLVYQTFEGIIGQVTANLAPIVSSIAEEFLSFVEAFQGFGGEGGSGIADALTEGLLDFAEYMASIFDAVVSELLSFGETMQVVSAIFEFVANTFVAVSETLRAIFNVFEMVGNTIMLGLGRVLEGLGSWVSSDLEQVGRDLASSSSQALSQNASEAGDAAANAFNAAVGERNFGREQTPSDGMFGTAVAEARERFGRRGAAAAAASETPQAMTAEQQYADKMQKLQQEMAENARKAEEERQKKIGDLNARYAEESAKIEEDRLDKLAEVNQKALEATDIRSGGISQVLALATGREDPAVSEARAQRKELEKISRETGKAWRHRRNRRSRVMAVLSYRELAGRTFQHRFGEAPTAEIRYALTLDDPETPHQSMLNAVGIFHGAYHPEFTYLRCIEGSVSENDPDPWHATISYRYEVPQRGNIEFEPNPLGTGLTCGRSRTGGAQVPALTYFEGSGNGDVRPLVNAAG
jgi:hypothetical protein